MRIFTLQSSINTKMNSLSFKVQKFNFKSLMITFDSVDGFLKYLLNILKE